MKFDGTHVYENTNHIRKVHWNQIPEKVRFKFLLTVYLHGKAYKYAKGEYLYNTAKPLCDDDNFKTHEHIILQFAKKTFKNAIDFLPVELQKSIDKNNMAEYDDVYIEFEKCARQVFKIYKLERRQGNPDNVQEVENMYKLI